MRRSRGRRIFAFYPGTTSRWPILSSTLLKFATLDAEDPRIYGLDFANVR
jgi:hypothetical protein